MTPSDVYNALEVACEQAIRDGYKIITRKFHNGKRCICPISALDPSNVDGTRGRVAADILGIRYDAVWDIIQGFDDTGNDVQRMHPSEYRKVGIKLRKKYILGIGENHETNEQTTSTGADNP